MINLLRIVVWVDFQNMLFPMVLKKFLLRLGQSLAGKKKKKAMNLKESKKGYMERFGERKEKVGML